MELVSLSENCLNALSKNSSALLREVQEKTKARVSLKEGGVEVEGEGESEWVAGQVLTAFNYGFEPKRAFKLLSEDYFIEVLDLEQSLNRHEKLVERYKARIIGENGKAKKKIEELTGAFIAVSGNFVAVIGGFDELKNAKEAVMRLLEGAGHASVYSYLEKRK
jgi:KH domain-containing protein